MAEVKDLKTIQEELASLALAKQTDITQTSGVAPVSGIATNDPISFFDATANGLKSTSKNNNSIPATATEAYLAPRRKPWVMTCQKWIEEASTTRKDQVSYIYFRVNPSEVSWRLPLRATEKKTRSGSVLHVWRRDQLYNDRGTYFDEPQLSITFQSGNIMPVLIDTKGDPVVPDGLDNFYTFLELMDEQKILGDGRANLIYLIINTRIFPSMTLAGIFTPEGTSWAESADDPNKVSSWTSNFTIYSTYPAINDRAEMSRVFKESGFGRI